MLTHEIRIERVQRTLRWLEEDVPLLEVRVAELSQERQKMAKRFEGDGSSRTACCLRDPLGGAHEESP